MGEWQLYKIADGRKTMLAVNNGLYSETIKNDQEYFAELIINGKCAYTTSKVKIAYLKQREQDDTPPSILDFWYLK